MRRRQFITGLGGTAITWPLPALAQRRARISRIGFLHPGLVEAANLRIAAVREGLRDQSNRDDLDVEIVRAVAEETPTRLAVLAQELATNGVDVIIAASPSAVRAAKDATGNIPIVAVDLESDPVASGWIASLAHPGGNVTGLFLDFPDFSAKCLQLLTEAIPGVSGVGVLWDPSTGPRQLRAVEKAATGLSISLQVVEVHAVAHLADAMASVSHNAARAVLLLSSPVFGGSQQLVADLALKNQLPSLMLFTEFAKVGGLLAYGPNLQDLFRQAAAVTRKLLLGARAADLPVERPARFQLAINLRTAKALGLTIPHTLLARADEIIE